MWGIKVRNTVLYAYPQSRNQGPCISSPYHHFRYQIVVSPPPQWLRTHNCSIWLLFSFACAPVTLKFPLNFCPGKLRPSDQVSVWFWPCGFSQCYLSTVSRFVKSIAISRLAATFSGGLHQSFMAWRRRKCDNKCMLALSLSFHSSSVDSITVDSGQRFNVITILLLNIDLRSAVLNPFSGLRISGICGPTLIY